MHTTKTDPSKKASQERSRIKGKRERDSVLQPMFAAARNQDSHSQSGGTVQMSSTPKAQRGTSDAGQNDSGLPGDLQTGLESLSGFDLSDVQVHYNSDTPVQLNALAYAQGTDIHVAPDQEQHLPHEGWHVVQQMQGRVSPTMQMNGVGINDNEQLEHEADTMGAEASKRGASLQREENDDDALQMKSDTVQRLGDVVQRVEPVSTFLGLTAAAWGTAANVAGVVGTGASIAGAAASAVTAGTDGVASMQFKQNYMTAQDENKLKTIAQFRIINEYVRRYLAANPDALEQSDSASPDQQGEQGSGTPAPAAEGAGDGAPTGAPSGGAIDSLILEQVKNSIQTELNAALETNAASSENTLEYRWGEDNTQQHGAGRGSGGSPESVGVTGYLRLTNLQTSIIKETPTLSAEAARAVGTVPGSGTELIVHRFIAGAVSGTVSSSMHDSLSVNIVGGQAEYTAGTNGAPRITLDTQWYWAFTWGYNVTTELKVVVDVQDTGGLTGTPTYIDGDKL